MIEKTKNADHGDGVMDAKFSPLLNEIATASLDGKFRIFGRVAKNLWKKRGITKGGRGISTSNGMVDIEELRDKNANKIAIIDNHQNM